MRIPYFMGATAYHGAYGEFRPVTNFSHSTGFKGVGGKGHSGSKKKVLSKKKRKIFRKKGRN